MRRLASKVWLPFLLCLFVVSTAKAYNLVQSNSASAGNNTNSVTFSGANTGGNTIVVAVGWVNGGTATILDSNNNSYSPVLVTSPGLSSEIWYASNIAAGTNTVTVTFNQWDNSTVSVFEFSGLAVSSIVDGSAGNSGNSNGLSVGNIATTQADDLLFAVGYGNSGGTLTAGSAYNMQQYSTWQGTHLGIETESVTSTGNYGATFSDTQAWTWIAQIVAFKAESSDESGDPTCGLSNDTSIHVPTDWSTFTAPSKGQSYVDSTFGCTVTRITDASTEGWNSSCNGSGCYLPFSHGYSTVSPFNANDSYLLFGDGWGEYFVTDLTGNIVVPMSAMPDCSGTSCTQYNSHDSPWFLWDQSNPNLFYYTKGNALMSGTISGSTVTTAIVHQFNEYSAINFMDASDVSQDGKNVVIVGGDTSGSSVENVFLYDFVDDLKGPIYTTGCTGSVDGPNNSCLHKLIMTADDNLTIDFASDGTEPEQGLRFWNGATPLPHLQDGTNHIDTGYDLANSSVFVEMGNGQTIQGETNPCPSGWGLDVRQIYDMSSSVCLIDIGLHPVDGLAKQHVSYDGNASQPWVGLSFFDDRTDSPEWFDTDSRYTAPSSSNWQYPEDEIDVVRVDAQNDATRFYRLARAYSRSEEDYDANPKAAISRDGKYVAFDSNMAYAHSGCPANFQTPTNCTDVYIVKVK